MKNIFKAIGEFFSSEKGLKILGVGLGAIGLGLGLVADNVSQKQQDIHIRKTVNDEIAKSTHPVE